MTGFIACIRCSVSIFAVVAASSAIAQVSTSAPPPSSAGAPAEDVTAQIDTAEAGDIVVTGSRLASSGFQAPTPVTVLSSAALEVRAPAAVAEALYELPAFFNNGPTQANRGNTSVGFNVLDLRGIGGVRTLVLVDGRRYTPTNTTTVFDTNQIPTGLVARTEVVTGGASSAYGSDAVAGVVNFILKRDLDGIEGAVQQGISQEGDNQEFTVNFAAGGQVTSGIRAMFGADYSKNEGVGFPGTGFYSRDWGRREYGRLSLPANRAAGLPASILGESIEFANKTPGSIILTSQRPGTCTAAQGGPNFCNFTAPGLNGLSFNNQGQPFPFQFGPIVGTDQMQGTGNYGQAVTGRQALRTPAERYVVLGRINVELAPDTEIFVEGNYAWSQGRGNTAQSFLDNHQILRSNPFIPAAVAAEMDRLGATSIRIGRLINEPGSVAGTNTNELVQGTIGIEGNLGGFKYDAYYSHGRNRYSVRVRNTQDVPNFLASLYAIRDPATGQIVCGPVAQAPGLTAARRAIVEPGCVPFNPFGVGSPSSAAFEYTTNIMRQDVEAKQDVAAVNLAGGLFDLGAGPVSFAVGGEWRRNSAVGDSDARSKLDAHSFGNYKPINGRITVKEGYLELGVPLLRETFVHSLDLNGAIRVTDYSTSGTVTTWKLGATFEPIEAIRFRITRSRDIRAPNIGELFAQGQGGVFTGASPFSTPVAGASGIIPTVTRGNPTLTPEIARTWTAGIVLTPGGFLRGFRASLDYYNIDIRDVISTPSGQNVLDACARGEADFCSRVERDTSALGVSRIFLDPFNLDRFKAEGYDLELSYTAPENSLGIPGIFSARTLANYTVRRDPINAQGVILGRQAGGGIPISGIQGMPKWQMTFNLNYALDGFNANAQLRAFSGIKYNANFLDPSDAGYNSALPNSINDNRYPGAAYVALAVSKNIIDDGKRRLQLFANVDNLLDRDPPFGWIQDVFTYDTIGRTFKFGARFSY